MIRSAIHLPNVGPKAVFGMWDWGGADMLYLVIETYRGGNAAAVYQRFRERGRMAPEGLAYVNSWVTEDLTRCYQIMETPDRVLLETWMAAWSDLVDFEVLPVITSALAAAVASRVEP